MWHGHRRCQEAWRCITPGGCTHSSPHSFSSLSAQLFVPFVPRYVFLTMPLFTFFTRRPYLSNSIFLGASLGSPNELIAPDTFWKFSSSCSHSGRPGSSISGSFSSGSFGLRQHGGTAVRVKPSRVADTVARRTHGRGNTGRGFSEARRQALFACTPRSSRATAGDARRHGGVGAKLAPRTRAAPTG